MRTVLFFVVLVGMMVVVGASARRCTRQSAAERIEQDAERATARFWRETQMYHATPEPTSQTSIDMVNANRRALQQRQAERAH